MAASRVAEFRTETLNGFSVPASAGILPEPVITAILWRSGGLQERPAGTESPPLQEDDAGSPSADAILASVIRSSLDCVIVTDEAGLVVEFNPAAEATFGYSRAEAVGRPIADLIVPPRLREAHALGHAAYVAGRAPRLLGRRVEQTAM